MFWGNPSKVHLVSKKILEKKRTLKRKISARSHGSHLKSELSGAERGFLQVQGQPRAVLRMLSQDGLHRNENQPGTQAEAERVPQVPGQPGPHSEPLSQSTRKVKKSHREPN